MGSQSQGPMMALDGHQREKRPIRTTIRGLALATYFKGIQTEIQSAASESVANYPLCRESCDVRGTTWELFW
jgi:hypothetical protein